ncbi:hypothetical protein KC926_03605 [Candidatus Kaiserbacteria bacterium]|nr:hypothetical protein [Candidatus Kaiserbacteria bacterium]
MDTVKFDGVEYTKASVVAKRFKYTSDYVGQLCRGKKVDARLVGRTWFVNIDSVSQHRSGKYSKLQAAESDTTGDEKHQEIKLSRTKVEPVSKKDPSLSIAKADSTESRSRTVKVSYDLDDGSLIPNITKKHLKPPRKIVIEQADAKKVKVSGKSKEFSFKADELPEVSLSGKLKVTTYPDAVSQLDAEKEPNNKDISDKRENIDTEKAIKKSPNKKLSVKVIKDSEREEEGIKVFKNRHAATRLVSPSKPSSGAIKPVSSVSFTPSTLNQVQGVKNSQSALVTFSPLITTFVAILFVVAIFSASSIVIVSDSILDSKIVMQVANLLAVFQAH